MNSKNVGEYVEEKDYSLEYIQEQVELLSTAIMDAERFFHLYKTIGGREKGKFQNFFGLCQRAFLFQIIVSIVSIFEKPNGRYPTATIIEIVARLKDEKQELEKPNALRLAEVEGLTSFRCIGPLSEKIYENNPKNIASLLAEFLQSLIPSETDGNWKNLKDIRNKMIAEMQRSVNGKPAGDLPQSRI